MVLVWDGCQTIQYGIFDKHIFHFKYAHICSGPVFWFCTGCYGSKMLPLTCHDWLHGCLVHDICHKYCIWLWDLSYSLRLSGEHYESSLTGHVLIRRTLWIISEGSCTYQEDIMNHLWRVMYLSGGHYESSLTGHVLIRRMLWIISDGSCTYQEDIMNHLWRVIYLSGGHYESSLKGHVLIRRTLWIITDGSCTYQEDIMNHLWRVMYLPGGHYESSLTGNVLIRRTLWIISEG